MADKITDITGDDLEIVTKEKSNFLLNECKTALNGYLDAADKVDNKSFILLGILLTIVSGLVGFIFASYNLKSSLWDQNWGLFLVATFLIVHFLTACIYLKKSFYIVDFHNIGNKPQNLAKKDFFSLSIEQMEFNEALSYDLRIRESVDALRKKSKHWKYGLNIAFYAFPVSLALMVLVWIIKLIIPCLHLL